MKELIETTLEEARQTLESFLEETTTVGIISQAASTCAEALKAGNKIIRYVEAMGCKGDVLLAISTSGHSENILKAAVQAHNNGMKVIALTSKGENELSRLADIAVCAPRAAHSDRIQEIHIKVIHILIQAIEAELGFE